MIIELQKIMLLIFILFIGYIIYKIYNYLYILDHTKCNIDNFNIDDIVIVNRTPEYSNFINKIIDNKSFIFTDEELKNLKNSHQIFNVKNNEQDITNISNIVYTNCKNNFNTSNYNDDIIDLSNEQYDKINLMLKNDIEKINEPNCFNTNILKNNAPIVKNYLKNYYQDIYGNKINADLKDYFIAYNTLINNNENNELHVDTLIGHSNFLIPEQYDVNNKLTNAYNIDWNRIINPLTHSI